MIGPSKLGSTPLSLCLRAISPQRYNSEGFYLEFAVVRLAAARDALFRARCEEAPFDACIHACASLGYPWVLTVWAAFVRKPLASLLGRIASRKHVCEKD